MSLDLLEALEDARAFEATHPFEHLSEFRVPFDELTKSEATESTLRALVERRGKVALVGPSGAGKSSVIASVLGPMAEELAEKSKTRHLWSLLHKWRSRGNVKGNGSSKIPQFSD